MKKKQIQINQKEKWQFKHPIYNNNNSNNNNNNNNQIKINKINKDKINKYQINKYKREKQLLKMNKVIHKEYYQNQNH